jgi:hypothetical protein
MSFLLVATMPFTISTKHTIAPTRHTAKKAPDVTMVELKTYWWLSQSWLSGLDDASPVLHPPLEDKQEHRCASVHSDPDSFDKGILSNPVFVPPSVRLVTQKRGLGVCSLPSCDQDTVKLRKALKHSQCPSSCAATTLVAKGGWNTGLGGEINGMIKPLLLSMKKGYTLLSPEVKWYGEHCDHKTSTNFKGATDLRCFFQPTSCCDAACVTSKHSKDPKKQCQLNDCTSCLGGKLGNWFKDGSYGLHGDKIVPAEYRHRGFVWFTAQLTAFLMVGIWCMVFLHSSPRHIHRTLSELRTTTHFERHID